MKRKRGSRPGDLPARFICYFDGCCEPVNPGGTAGLGAVIFENGERVWEHSSMIPPSPTTSNNVAEYRAFIAILDHLAKEGMQHERIIIYGDSRLVFEQCFGRWRIKGGHYVPFAREAKAKLEAFTRISGFWIPRDENSIADELSKAEVLRAGVEFRIQPEQ